MFLCECGSRAEQAGLRVGYQANGQRRHEIGEAAFRPEARSEAGCKQSVADSQAKAAGDDHARRALHQGNIARDRAERKTEAVDRGGGEAILPVVLQRWERMGRPYWP